MGSSGDQGKVSFGGFFGGRFWALVPVSIPPGQQPRGLQKWSSSKNYYLYRIPRPPAAAQPNKKKPST